MNMNSNYLLPFSEQQNMLIKNKLTISSLWLLILTFVLLAFVFRSYDTSVIVKSDVEENACDLFMGKWVRDPTGSLYNSSTCLMLPDSKNCNKFGKDQGYLHWKWKPDACELPRFDAADFMRIVRGKTMAFVGDSLARNQMESLLCLLSQTETPTKVYKDTNDKLQTWHFPSHNFTLMAIWANFLVDATERVINGTVSNAFDIHLDRVNPAWASKLPKLHYVVLSSGNWFFRPNYLYKDGTLMGCIGCTDKNLTHFTIEFAFRSVFATSLQFISRCEIDDSLVTLLRTFSPSHFENGSWFTGGYCNRTRPMLDEREALGLVGSALGLREIQLEEIERAVKEGGLRGRKRFGVLDVSRAMMMRADGHPGSHLDRRWMKSSNDCLHWCLPGPVDMWNDVLFAAIRKNSLLH